MFNCTNLFSLWFLPGVTEIAEMRGPLREGALYRDPLPAQNKRISSRLSCTFAVKFSVHILYGPPAFSFRLKSFRASFPCNQKSFLNKRQQLNGIMPKINLSPEYIYQTHVSRYCYDHPDLYIQFPQNEVSQCNCHCVNRNHNMLVIVDKGEILHIKVPQESKLHMSCS